MARYIDADLLYRETEQVIKNNNAYGRAVVDGEFLDLINDAHTEDVVEVCSCENCAYAKVDIEGADLYECRFYRDMRKGSDFCNYGKRKAL